MLLGLAGFQDDIFLKGLVSIQWMIRMNNKGWISVHRKITENWVWDDKPFSQGQAWIDMLIMANHSENKFPFRNEIVTVEVGTFVTSELKLMERWGWSKSKVRRFLELLVSDEMIVKKTDRKKTTIFIVNYSVFQEIETTKKLTIDQSKTDGRLIKDTNNNDNNANNENKRIRNFVPPTLEEVRSYCRERNNAVDPERFVDFYEAKGWMVGRNKMRDWKAAVRTWEQKNRNANEKGGEINAESGLQSRRPASDFYKDLLRDWEDNQH